VRWHSSRGSFTVDIVGRGPEQRSVEQLVGVLGLEDRARVRGFVDEETKGDILRRAGLHVCASDAEGWGQVVIETAAYGVPTVARRVPGLRDSIVDGETGWLVPADGGRDAIVDGLASAIRKAVADLEDPLRSAEVASACRERAAHFSWAAMRAESAELVARELGRRVPETPS
jgi:glycosyltransferase involved in cell wall biosynthesis